VDLRQMMNNWSEIAAILAESTRQRHPHNIDFLS
jgi:hypothetical protein